MSDTNAFFDLGPPDACQFCKYFYLASFPDVVKTECLHKANCGTRASDLPKDAFERMKEWSKTHRHAWCPLDPEAYKKQQCCGKQQY